MFSLYLTLKFIHVLAVIFWIGGITAMAIWTFRAAGEGDLTSLAVTMRHASFYGQRVVGPASGFVLLAGIAMVITAKISWSTPWVIWGLMGIVIHMVLGFAVLAKNSERIAQLAVSPNPDRTQLAAAVKKQKTAATIYVLIMASVVWAMVAKPTF